MPADDYTDPDDYADEVSPEYYDDAMYMTPEVYEHSRLPVEKAEL